MGIDSTLLGVFDVVHWLDATVPFFAVLPAFLGIFVLLRFFAGEVHLHRPTPPHHEREYRFDPDEFE
ncbi:hypothetical protein [Haladaptatus sp. NG-WS-4]